VASIELGFLLPIASCQLPVEGLTSPPNLSVMDSLKEQVDLDHLPRHIAIIMDGNGRWAKEQGQDRLYGHFHGVESVRNIVEGCAELGVQYLTLYAFSTENWERPEYEVVGLMELLVNTIQKELESLNKNNIKLHVIGDMNMLPDYAREELKDALKKRRQIPASTSLWRLAIVAVGNC
jgi:undecaprenyl diphosphate synthase